MAVWLVGLVAAGYVFFLAPFYWLWNDLSVMAAPADWRGVVILQVATIFVMRWLVDHHFKAPLVSTLLHPAGFSFLFLAALHGGARKIAGAGVRWKQRLYGRESCVE